MEGDEKIGYFSGGKHFGRIPIEIQHLGNNRGQTFWRDSYRNTKGCGIYSRADVGGCTPAPPPRRRGGIFPYVVYKVITDFH